MVESDLFVDSLRNRIRAMNTLWQRAIADMSLAQVNHHERAGVLPIAFSFCHFMQAQDQSVSRTLLGEAPIWQSGGWAARVAVTVDAFGREESVAQMEQLRFGDLDAWKAYQEQVIGRTGAALERLTPALLAEVVLPRLPPTMQNIFCGLVVGPGKPIRRLEVLECFVYQHGLRHMGEVEHGRALIGLQGMTS